MAVEQRVRARLLELRQELERGQAELDQVERRAVYLREMLLRIGGAAQVLEELLSQPQDEETGSASVAQPDSSGATAP